MLSHDITAVAYGAALTCTALETSLADAPEGGIPLCRALQNFRPGLHPGRNCSVSMDGSWRPCCRSLPYLWRLRRRRNLSHVTLGRPDILLSDAPLRIAAPLLTRGGRYTGSPPSKTFTRSQVPVRDPLPMLRVMTPDTSDVIPSVVVTMKASVPVGVDVNPIIRPVEPGP